MNLRRRGTFYNSAVVCVCVGGGSCCKILTRKRCSAAPAIGGTAAFVVVVVVVVGVLIVSFCLRLGSVGVVQCIAQYHCAIVSVNAYTIPETVPPSSGTFEKNIRHSRYRNLTPGRPYLVTAVQVRSVPGHVRSQQ